MTFPSHGLVSHVTPVLFTGIAECYTALFEVEDDYNEVEDNYSKIEDYEYRAFRHRLRPYAP